MHWENLTSEDQLHQLKEISDHQAVLIFKHSTRCNISTMAKARLERQWNIENSLVRVFYLDLLRFRNISDKIASAFQVEHESPQVLLIKERKCIYHSSHNAIDAAEIKNAAIKN